MRLLRTSETVGYRRGVLNAAGASLPIACDKTGARGFSLLNLVKPDPAMMDRTAPLRVLLVEDDALIGLTLALVVADLGFTPIGPAASVQEALETLERERPDAALLDVDLGRETVFPIADELQARGIPFAFATAYATDAKLRFERAPILIKPYGPDEIRRVLATLDPHDPRQGTA